MAGSPVFPHPYPPACPLGKRGWDSGCVGLEGRVPSCCLRHSSCFFSWSSGVWHWGELSQDDFAFVICQPDGATFATVAVLGESPRLCHRAPVGPGDSLLSQGHPQPHLNTDPASPSLNTRAFPCLDSVCLSWAFWVTEGSSEMGGGGALQDVNSFLSPAAVWWNLPCNLESIVGWKLLLWRRENPVNFSSLSGAGPSADCSWKSGETQ